MKKDIDPLFNLIIRFIHPAMMARYGCGAVRAQAYAKRSVRVSSWKRRLKRQA